MALRPLAQESEAYQRAFAEIDRRLWELNPPDGFNIEDLFPEGEWRKILGEKERQHLGRRFGREVDLGARGEFPFIVRNAQPVELGGNEARYNYDRAKHSLMREADRPEA